MIKINYKFKALSPIHTGSDEDLGTMRRLRRQKILINEIKEEKSNFKNDEERRQGVIYILKNIYKNIDKTDIKQKRLFNIYSEFQTKILAASNTYNRFNFLNNICNKWNINNLEDENVIKILEKFNDDEFLNLIRNETQYLILKIRSEIKQKKEDNNLLDILEDNKDSEIKFIKQFEEIPFISGNSIRGLLRRLLIKDYCQLTEINKLSKNIYHQLFTGGNITDSTAFEDIEKREDFIKMCPAIGLLGSAIGNMTIEGDLKVGMVYPECQEMNTGNNSFWSLLDIIFQTRNDSSKTENNIEIVNQTDQVNQMKYEYEVFIPGTIFNHVFVLISSNELIISCFYRMLRIFIKNNYICGSSSVGNGEIDLSELKKYIKNNEDELYLKYLNDNKKEIKEYMENRNC